MSKQIPVLFSTSMVQAILEDRKLMTRRIVKFPKDFTGEVFDNAPYGLKYSSSLEGGTVQRLHCPYGQPGDILWVRESWAPAAASVELFSGRPNSGGYVYKAGRLGTTYPYVTPEGHIDINKPYTKITESFDKNPANGKWKPSIHMPKDACRIFLEITSVRVERLQDITPQDAINEGLEYKDFPEVDERGYKLYGTEKDWDGSPVVSFFSLWDQINGEGAFLKNPWVWAVSFKRIDPCSLT